ncbi:MAG: AGE family epimerase/isomerase [Defluviitaleaceae bacterium]|nr:AGE family epimerase/isomerase [Defluviitaleaceae bacterium]
MNGQTAEKWLVDILDYWQGLKDEENGGFWGESDFYGIPKKLADKGCIANSRILWTFSAAYRAVRNESYKKHAEIAYDFMQKAFIDEENGGLFWLARADGTPLETKKHFYNIAFGVYALSEFYLATEDEKSLNLAIQLFEKMEQHGRDKIAGGYIEAAGQKWQAIDDFRLSDKDMNGPKSMNTNLHVMEAYTNLLRAVRQAHNKHRGRMLDAPDTSDTLKAVRISVSEALSSLMHVIMDKIIDKTTFRLFFEMDWTPLKAGISYGHDIEGSWLLHDSALALGGEELLYEAIDVATEIAEATYNIAIDHENGGLKSGISVTGKPFENKEWWPQAEAVPGFYNAFKMTDDKKFKDAAESIWEYISRHFIDTRNGEWHNELFYNNWPDVSMPKTGFWKCPYHNGRMCLQIMKWYK